MLYEENGLFRYENNPIIKPSDYPGADAVFNCGQTMYGDTTILLCAIKKKDGSMPFMHIARSKDGIHFTFDHKPFITQSSLPHIHDLDGWPIDPRITYFPEEEV